MSWTLEQALRMTWEVVKANFATFFVVVLVVDLPQLVVELADVNQWVDLAVSALTSILASVALTVGTLQALGGKRRPDVANLLQWIFTARAGPAIVLGIVQWLVIALGFTLLIVPGLWVLTIWMVAMPALIVERIGMGEALNRSTALTRHRRWRVFGTFIVTVLVVGIPVALFNALVGNVMGLREDSAGDVILTYLTTSIIDVALSILPVVLYVLLRAEQDGATVDQIAAAVD
ncbi:MAG: hypothetical protein JO339_26620 [Alphaproteobacteria bacterium]|nr:hypothetical protein [Alphaproteobacteria bacterium]